MDSELQNANPEIFSSKAPARSYDVDEKEEDDDGTWDDESHGMSELASDALRALAGGDASADVRRRARDTIDALEVFELIRHLNDPEHPLTLEALNVAQLELIRVNDVGNTVDIAFTPTIPHCSMATLIGLCIRVKLIRELPARFKVSVRITPGTHDQEESINKQLNDKERVAAALENASLIDLVNKSIAGTDPI